MQQQLLQASPAVLISAAATLAQACRHNQDIQPDTAASLGALPDPFSSNGADWKVQDGLKHCSSSAGSRRPALACSLCWGLASQTSATLMQGCVAHACVLAQHLIQLWPGISSMAPPQPAPARHPTMDAAQAAANNNNHHPSTGPA